MKYIVLSVCRTVVGAGTMEEECCCETIRITALMLGENRKEISSLDIHVKPAIIWENHLDKLNMSDDTRKRMEYAPALPEAFQMLVRWCYAIDSEFEIYTWGFNGLEQMQLEIENSGYEPDELERRFLECPVIDFKQKFMDKLQMNGMLSLNGIIQAAEATIQSNTGGMVEFLQRIAAVISIWFDPEKMEVLMKNREQVSEYVKNC